MTSKTNSKENSFSNYTLEQLQVILDKVVISNPQWPSIECNTLTFKAAPRLAAIAHNRYSDDALLCIGSYRKYSEVHGFKEKIRARLEKLAMQIIGGSHPPGPMWDWLGTFYELYTRSRQSPTPDTIDLRTNPVNGDWKNLPLYFYNKTEICSRYSLEWVRETVQAFYTSNPEYFIEALKSIDLDLETQQLINKRVKNRKSSVVQRAKTFTFREQVFIATQVLNFAIRSQIRKAAPPFTDDSLLIKFSFKVNSDYPASHPYVAAILAPAGSSIGKAVHFDKTGQQLMASIGSVVNIPISTTIQFLMNHKSPVCRRFAVTFGEATSIASGLLDDDSRVRLAAQQKHSNRNK